MKKTLLFLLFIFICFISLAVYSQNSYLDLDFGTYFGDNRFSLQGSAVDGNGDLYIAGYIKYNDSSDVTEDYPYFEDALHQSEFAGGVFDCFIAKFNSSGELLWATLFGGEKTDVLTGITTDKNNNVYIVGVTNSLTGISTTNAMQVERLGEIDMFIAKFNTNGEIIWSTYYGNSENDNQQMYNESYFTGNHFFNNTVSPDGSYILHDGGGHLYLTLRWDMIVGMETIEPHKGSGNNEIIKFTDDGEPVWHTSYGVNSNNYLTGLCYCNSSLYINGYVLSVPHVDDSTYYGNENSLQEKQGGVTDTYLAKFSSNGDFVWGTYYGGVSGSEAAYGNTLTCDKLGGLYNAINTTTSDTMTTPGAFQEQGAGIGGSFTPLITRFDDGNESETVPTVDWSTFLGKNSGIVGNENHPLYIKKANDNAIYISGTTSYMDNISTEGIWEDQPAYTYNSNAFIAKFDLNGNKIWGTYYSGEGDSRLVEVLPYGENESFYLTGLTKSHTGMTTENSVQPEWFAWNEEENFMNPMYGIFISHFKPRALGLSPELQTINFTVYPNPNSGSFSIQQHSDFRRIVIDVLDLQGRVLFSSELQSSNVYTIDLDIESGVYLVNFMMDGNCIYSEKIVISN